jgi:predicted acetyltransferase
MAKDPTVQMSSSPGAGLTEVALMEPSLIHRDSYRSFVQEFADRGEAPVPFSIGFSSDDFTAFLERLAACARGEGLPEGFVPHSTYWLVSGGIEVVAVSNLRHRLTYRLRRDGGNIGYGVRPSARGRGFGSEILRQTLLRAQAIGLREVLITCAKTNLPSVRTIVGNGGVLDSEELLPERGEVIQRYWISLTEPPDASGEM